MRAAERHSFQNSPDMPPRIIIPPNTMADTRFFFAMQSSNFSSQIQLDAMAAMHQAQTMRISTLSGDRLASDLAALAACDEDIARSLAERGHPIARVAPQGFSTLARIVAGQQVSTKAAATVFARIEAACGGKVDAEQVAALDWQGLRGCGLSGRKTDYILELARAEISGFVDIDGLPGLDDETVIKTITALRGFGQWSADIYLMFALGRGDVMPAEDMAVRAGYGMLKGLNAAPDAKALRHLTGHWAPYRSAGALVLWQIYGAASLDQM